MAKFGFLFLLFAGVVLNSIAASPNSLIDFQRLLRATKIPDTCIGNTATFICKNCKELKYCLRNGNAKPEEIPALSCSNGQTCSSGVCTPDTENACVPYSSVKFTCTQAGIFPDANCTKYHYCVKNSVGVLTDFVQECDVDNKDKYGFNIETLFCDTKLGATGCPADTLPVCKETALLGPITKNPRYYYICVNNGDGLYPIIQVCPYGRTYATDKGCVAQGGGGSGNGGGSGSGSN